MQNSSNNIYSRFVSLKKALLSNQNDEKASIFQKFDKCGYVPGINNIKWESPKRNQEKKEIYPLWIADMDFPVPDFIQKALETRVACANYGYTSTSDEYFQAIIQWFFKNHSFILKKTDIFRFSAKSLTGLGILIQAFSQPGDGIILATPIYLAFFHVIDASGRKIVESPMIYKDRTFFIDYDDLEMKILKNRPKMMIFCNPHNPAGRVWKKNEIERVHEICLRYEVLLISDEVFGDLVFEGHQHVVAAYEPYDQNTILMGSLGKSFNLNGVETGFVVTKNPKLMEKIMKIGEQFALLPDFGNIFSDVATKAAYSSEGKIWLKYVKEYIYDNYLMMVEYFKENLKEIVPVVLEGSYILLCDFEELGISEEEFMKRSEEENIFVNPGSKFHTQRKMFRINIACSRQVLRGALERWTVIFKKKY